MKLRKEQLKQIIKKELRILKEQNTHAISVDRAMKLVKIFNKKMGLNINPSKLKQNSKSSDFFYADYMKEIRKVLPTKMADTFFKGVYLEVESDNIGGGEFEIRFSFLITLTNYEAYSTLVAEMVVDEEDNVISFTKGRTPFSLI